MLSRTVSEVRWRSDPQTWVRSYRLRSRAALALDRASVREIDQDGRLKIEITNISKANVCPYLGREIPGDLGLDPDKIYRLLRDPEELARAAETFNNLPVLSQHYPVFAEDYQEKAQKLTVGCTGSDASFEPPYLRCSMKIWDGEAIRAIQDGSQKEISCGYHYRPDMKAGSFEGTEYDGVMRDIIGNHVALVREGRAGADVVVGDSRENVLMKKPMTRVAAFSIGLLVPYVRTKLAADQSVDLRPILCGLTSEDVKTRGPAIATALRKVTRGKLAKDTSLGEVAEFLDMLKGSGENDEDADEAVDPAVQKSMEKSAKIEPTAEKKEEEPEEFDSDGELKNFLKGKLSEDDFAHACNMMGAGAKDVEKGGEEKLEQLGAAHDLDPRGAEKGGKGGEPEQERRDEEKEWRRKEGATDEPEATEGTPRAGGKMVGDKKFVTQDEVAQIAKTAAESARKIERDIREAERVVQPWVGNLAMTFDSAEQVYRKALKMMGVPGVDRVHESALRTILEMQPKPGNRKAPLAAAKIAADSDVNVGSFADRFPDAGRIRLT